MITVIRGSSGSGKSYPVYRLLDRFPFEPVVFPPGVYPNDNKKKDRIGGYLYRDLFVMGSYPNTSLTGGGDSLPGGPTMHRAWIIELSRVYKHLLFESLFDSLSSLRIWKEVRAAAAQPIMHLFLDTPLEVCRERVTDRRSRGRSAGRPWNQAATVDNNWRRMLLQWNAHKADPDVTAYRLRHATAVDGLLKALEYGGWDPR